MADAWTGAADSANGTNTADGAGNTPIAPSTNCGPELWPQVKRQWVILRPPASDLRLPCSGHSPLGCAPGGQQSGASSDAATAALVRAAAEDAQQADTGTANSRASCSTVSVNAPEASQRRRSLMKPLPVYRQLTNRKRTEIYDARKPLRGP
jgi:hypothetical protein